MLRPSVEYPDFDADKGDNFCILPIYILKCEYFPEIKIFKIKIRILSEVD